MNDTNDSYKAKFVKSSQTPSNLIESAYSGWVYLSASTS